MPPGMKGWVRGKEGEKGGGVRRRGRVRGDARLSAFDFDGEVRESRRVSIRRAWTAPESHLDTAPAVNQLVPVWAAGAWTGRTAGERRPLRRK